MIDAMREITLTLTVEETNLVLDALGNQPFKEVYGLIGKIQNQAAAQLSEPSPVSSDPPPPKPTKPKPVRINPEAPIAADPDAPKQ
jgi:hypothetical protein